MALFSIPSIRTGLCHGDKGMTDEIAPKPYPIDTSKFLDEQRRQGIQVLHPVPDELESRIRTISRIGGKKANWVLLYNAWAMWQIKMEVIRTGKLPTADFLNKLSMANFYLLHAPSLDGAGREEIVKIARSTEQVVKKPSIIDRVIG